MIAREIMTENPATVSSSAKVVDAAELLMSLDVRHLPVVDGTELVGMISDRDLRGLYIPRFEDNDAMQAAMDRYQAPIASIMTPDVVTIDPDTAMSDIITHLLDQKVGAIAVTDPSTGDLLGIVSYIDVLRAVNDAG